jgi:hypothetical protein
MKVMFSKHEYQYNIHEWDETLQLLTLWSFLCAFEEALNQYILQSFFFKPHVFMDMWMNFWRRNTFAIDKQKDSL